MNIVYKFTSKVTGKWYIGSKTECKVVDGYILNRNGRKYFTSSFDKDLIEEFSKGNMVLEILEDNVNREVILDVESKWQERYNVMTDPLCYNKVIANQVHMARGGRKQGNNTHGKITHNVYGQSLNEFANNTSVVSRKDNKAVKVGFTNYGTMVKEVLEEKERTGCTTRSLDVKYGQNGFFKRCLVRQSLEMFEQHIPKSEIRELMLNGASFFKACELVGVSDIVARHEFGDYFYKILDVEEKMSIVNGFDDRDKLDKHIMREYLSGKPMKKISEELDNISHSTVRRTVDRITREKLKIEDFK